MPARFRFRLETLLRLRRVQQRQAQRSVGAAQAEVAHAERLIALTEAEIRRQQAELRDAQHGAPDRATLEAQSLIRGRAWIVHLRRMSLQQQEMRADAQRRLGDALRALTAARTQTRIVEKLRERRLAEFRASAERRTDAALDELAQRMLYAVGGSERTARSDE